jgi:biotin transport system permease protein
MMGSLYLPGQTWLHRVSPGLKLGLLALGGTGLMWLRTPLPLLFVLLLICFFLHSAGASLTQVWQQLRVLVWMMLVFAGLSAWSEGGAQAVAMLLRLSILVLAALLVSMTTSLTQMMQVVVWLLAPFARLGWVNAERVALSVGLTLRLIPELGVQWHEIREAQVARGCTPNPFTMTVPMLTRTLRRAHEIAEAIDARA